MLPRLRSHLPHWRRALRRRRRVLSLLLGAVLLAATLPPLAAALAPPSTTGTTVVTVTRDVPADTPLDASALTTTEVADPLVPPGSSPSVEDLVGVRTAVPLPAGSPVLTPMLQATDRQRPGPAEALVVVPVPALLVTHVTPGTRLELHRSRAGVDGTPREDVVTARVVTIGSAGDDGALGGGAPAEVELVVAVPRADAGTLSPTPGEGAVVVSVVDGVPDGGVRVP